MAVEIKGLTKRSEDYSKWYNELVVKADLAEQSAVRGCMVIKPYGYTRTIFCILQSIVSHHGTFLGKAFHVFGFAAEV